MATEREQFTETLKANAADFDITFGAKQTRLLGDYYELLLKWNDRLHLVAPCSPEEFAVRHVLESLLLLKHLSRAATVVDVGSGGGLPIIPCLLVRDDVRATLIESSERKIVFLREALRPARPPDRIRLINARVEEINLPASDFLSCRAVERFSELLPLLIQRARPNTTALFFAGETLRREIQKLIPTAMSERIPHSEKRFLVSAFTDEKAV
jgi:16S rRNA (guanine527-N7)-methyltransferase